MITEQAVARTISELRCSGTHEKNVIAEAFTALLNHQDDLDNEEEKQHNKIINEINAPF